MEIPQLPSIYISPNFTLKLPINYSNGGSRILTLHLLEDKAGIQMYIFMPVSEREMVMCVILNRQTNTNI